MLELNSDSSPCWLLRCCRCSPPARRCLQGWLHLKQHQNIISLEDAQTHKSRQRNDIRTARSLLWSAEMFMKLQVTVRIHPINNIQWRIVGNKVGKISEGRPLIVVGHYFNSRPIRIDLLYPVLICQRQHKKKSFSVSWWSTCCFRGFFQPKLWEKNTENVNLFGQHWLHHICLFIHIICISPQTSFWSNPGNNILCPRHQLTTVINICPAHSPTPSASLAD